MTKKVASAISGSQQGTSSDAQLMKDAAATHARLLARHGLDWADWVTIGRGLQPARQIAMQQAATNRPIGTRYNAAFKTILVEQGLDKIAKNERSCILQVMDKLDLVQTWRESLPDEHRQRLNNPVIVWSGFRKHEAEGAPVAKQRGMAAKLRQSQAREDVLRDALVQCEAYARRKGFMLPVSVEGIEAKFAAMEAEQAPEPVVEPEPEPVVVQPQPEQRPAVASAETRNQGFRTTMARLSNPASPWPPKALSWMAYNKETRAPIVCASSRAGALEAAPNALLEALRESHREFQHATADEHPDRDHDDVSYVTEAEVVLPPLWAIKVSEHLREIIEHPDTALDRVAWRDVQGVAHYDGRREIDNNYANDD